MNVLISLFLVAATVLTGAFQTYEVVSSPIIGYEEEVVELAIETEYAFQGPGARTPEEAALNYLNALANEDVDGMVRAYAIEDWAAHIDLVGYLELNKAWNINLAANLLPDSPMGAQYNVYSCLSAVTRHVFYDLFSNANDYSDDYSSNYPLNTTKDPDAVNDFLPHISTKNSEGFSTISNINFLSLGEIYTLSGNTESYTRSNDYQMRSYKLLFGADEFRPIIATLTMNGEPYYFFATVGRYDHRWYMVSNLNSASLMLGYNTNSGSLVPAK